MTNITNEHVTIALVGYLIVFTVLVSLVAVFTHLPKLLTLEARKRMRKKGHEVKPEQASPHVSGDENAAIAMALHLFFSEIHDEESNVITIRKVSRSYSPWSSKIYGLNSINRKEW
jgi:glutaconyl-CoA/methylmalonyl-CoA decarboxylase subunit delta